ncbi:MAG: TetR/AcrR family transcriptional regulator [Rhodospirillales bacterium]|nr:TetR/AcrR family transcriptional regulator [Rhodospirillales bacterium]
MPEAKDRPQSYSSPAIIARRQRILDETRKVIAEQGVAGLSMNEIGLRAGVAKRTLYNAFQTRERMIAAAIQEYFESYVKNLVFVHPPGTLMYDMERVTAIIRRNRHIRNYIKAIMALYFSPDLDDDIWQAMHSIGTKPSMLWLGELHRKKQLQPWITVDRLVDDVVRLRYATINDWALGRIPDDEIIVHLVSTYLTFVVGATRGAARKEIEEMLTRVKIEGEAALPLPRKLMSARG